MKNLLGLFKKLIESFYEVIKGFVMNIGENVAKIVGIALTLIIFFAVFYFWKMGLYDDTEKIEVETSLGDKYYID